MSNSNPIMLSLSSLFNHFLLKNVNFGDKIYDNVAITIFGLLFSTIILYASRIFRKNTYNWLKYRLCCRRNKDPFDFKECGYFFEDPNTIKKYKYIILSTTSNIFTYLNENIFPKLDNLLVEEDKDTCFHINEPTTKIYSTTNKNVSPLFYDGENIVYCDYAPTRSYSSILLFSKDISSTQKMLGYITMKIEEQNEKVVPENIGIYEFIDLKNPFKFVGNISKNKTLDKLYYDQKDDLVELVNKFKNGNMYPKTTSIDNKLGILLYGPPGTGKTGTILGIANYLNRNILTVNFTKLTKRKELDHILQSENYSKYIYIFDEFDCILNVLTNKKEIEKDSKEIDWSKILAVSDSEERKEIFKMMSDSIKKEENDNIDIGYLLSKLDGLEDCSDRIIIATTNHPEYINPALLRPGRFDIKLCLSNCSTKMYYDILKSFFNKIDESIIKEHSDKLIPKKWSPLEVYNYCLISNNFYKTIDDLLKDK